MAINENIIAAFLDGNISYEEAHNAMGGFSMADNALIDEAFGDDDTITRIAEGADPQLWSDELSPVDEFQLPELAIIAQEADDSEDTDEFEIVDYADDPVDNLPTDADTDDTFLSDQQIETTSFPDYIDLPDFDYPDIP